jgi:hypothetical protein
VGVNRRSRQFPGANPRFHSLGEFEGFPRRDYPYSSCKYKGK